MQSSTKSRCLPPTAPPTSPSTTKKYTRPFYAIDVTQQKLVDPRAATPHLRHGELAGAHGVALEGVLRERARRRDDQEDLRAEAADAEEQVEPVWKSNFGRLTNRRDVLP